MKKALKKQLKFYQKNNNFLCIEEPAILDKGIQNIDKQIDTLSNFYINKKTTLKIVKFVPASGAATRMFKDLILLREESISSNETKLFFDNILQFPFSNFIQRALKKIGAKREDLQNPLIANQLIEQILKNFNYTILPKGLIPFHKYNNEIRTAFQEHFIEGVQYCQNKGNIIPLHFTVGEKHQALFRLSLRSFISNYEQLYNCSFHVSFSVQDPDTHSIAVNLDNTPFLDKKGNIVLRPAGHGALIKNLNHLDADIIFIKNIDNVTVDSKKENTFKYKKALAGLLLQIQEKIFSFLKNLDQNILKIDDALLFLQNDLNIILPKDFKHLSEAEKKSFIKQKLNRPTRVCGMVKNEGQAGGGPFWVKNQDTNEITLQIVESAQINFKDIQQKEIFESSTHFNPVDIVCGVKDYKGIKFDLEQFVDPDTYFIAEKTHEGKPIKALELPGLWNGAMSNWNTLFIEVPLNTFSPVKTVLDLLKPAHQGE
ncbi:hypothetical protein UJ101_01167 [Flavobacteriaceae bacterium UJ101]|nr:hypothetical protein UJ101_01167 [Flavobacteriaceae bacterium UJ101]